MRDREKEVENWTTRTMIVDLESRGAIPSGPFGID